MGVMLRAVLAIGAIYALSPVDVGPAPDLRQAASQALPAVTGALPSSTTLGRDAAAAALAACAAKPQACADMAATLRGSMAGGPAERPPAQPQASPSAPPRSSAR
ncbi:hypothetical protein [Alsobacter sp. R-9]